MKATLPDLESQFITAALEEAADLIRQTTEYNIQATGESTYQIIATQPAYHVELSLLPDNIIQAVCHCTAFKRHKECKHGLAAMLMLRDAKLRKRSTRQTRQHQSSVLDDALSKLHITDLKRFIKQYAKSHATFRIELLAETLYLTKKPDYPAFLMEITPIDKRGQLKVNRSNIKLLRGTLTVLHKQAQQLVRDKDLPGAFRILGATMLHMQRLMTRFPAFQGQLATDYKLALRTLEVVCRQTMAPRLQDAVIQFAMELSEREGHQFFKGYPIVLRLVENFILDEKSRSGAIELVTRKIRSDQNQQASWAGILLHWNRIWERNAIDADLMKLVQPHLPEILLSGYQLQDYEDVLFLLPMIRYERMSPALLQSLLHASLRSAKSLGRQEWIRQLLTDLCIQAYDIDAFEQLLAISPEAAKEMAQTIAGQLQPGQHEQADRFMLHAWHQLNQPDQLFEYLEATGNYDWLIEYAPELSTAYREKIITIMARHIHATREMYGGLQARQRLSNIISHLKSIDLYSPVIELVKRMESKPTTDKPPVIKGFVFDLDGVIVDTAIHHFKGWKKLMQELGVAIADEDDHHTRGASRMESLEYLLQKYGLTFSQEEKEALAARKNGYYLEAIAGITPDDLLPGAYDFLKASRKAGLLLALGSASKNARGVLDKLGINDAFDAILDGNDAKESKPDPEIFIKATAALGLAPEEVIVFEDAAKGVQAAIAAGNHVVGLGDPFTLRDADIVIPDLSHATPADIIERIA